MQISSGPEGIERPLYKAGYTTASVTDVFFLKTLDITGRSIYVKLLPQPLAHDIITPVTTASCPIAGCKGYRYDAAVVVKLMLTAQHFLVLAR